MSTNIFYLLKLYSTSLLIIFLILMSWNIGYSYGCYMLFFPLIMMIIISHSFIELKMQQRMCYKRCYFTESSFFAKILSSRFFVTLIYFVISILMSISLLFGIIDYSRELWIYLSVHIALVIILYQLLYHFLRTIIRNDYLAIFAKEWTINISSFVLLVVFIYLTLYLGYVPGYLHDSLPETINSASSAINSDCYLSNMILKIKIEIDSLFWWLVSRNAEHIQDQKIKVVFWLIFIVFNSLVLLGLNRFIVQSIYLLDQLFKGTISKRTEA